jgi:hypothetical protein
VRERLEVALRRNVHPNARNIEIKVSDEPQLAVIKGLLEDRKQQYETGSNCLATRIARASYGVICRVKYEPGVHMDEDWEFDRYKPKVKWARNQIDWLVRKVTLVYRLKY